MQIVPTFGRWVEELSDEHPEQAQKLLKTGWQAQDLKLQLLPEKQLMPADQYLARLMMDVVIKPLKSPEDSVIVSIFTPCELMQEVGLSPFNAESYSCYFTGSWAADGFVQEAENAGIAETLCSYHKIFLGAAEKGVLPRPRCIVYTNLTCDANLLTFRRLAELYEVPSFFIDVPMHQTKDNVEYVANQLRDLAGFLTGVTGKTINEDDLSKRVARGRASLQNFNAFQTARADRYIPTDLNTPLYAGMTNNILLGTEEEERYTQMLLRDVQVAAPKTGKHIYWMHTIPFWSQAVRDALSFSERAQIVGCELSQTFEPDYDPEQPYEAMAQRMVNHVLNGPANRRIEAGIRHAKQTGADGAVWFNHWGCKHTLGSAQLAKQRFEEEGIPLLLLDGDGADRRHGGEGQTATRLGAFLEMLEESHE